MATRHRESAPVTPSPDVVLAGLRPAWVGIDLDRLDGNLRWLRRRAGAAKVLAVVKADAYGHGAVPVARALDGAVDAFGVALVEEGVELRQAGVAAPLLILGPVLPAQAASVEEHGLVPSVSSAEGLRMWAERTAGRTAPLGIHLEVDTGMARLGVPADELPAALELVRRSRGLRLDGLLSHLADADDLASPRTAAQERRFAAALDLLGPAEREHLLVHFANSAGAMHHPATRHDMVRLGLALYGVDPRGEEKALRPVMGVAARIVQLREIAAGTPIGYLGRWQAERPSRIAVVPVGYADGYPWRLSNRAAALVGGRRVPVVGAVSMDMLFVDVTDVPEAGLGDPVVLMGEAVDGRADAIDRDAALDAGKAPAERVGAGELADWAGTIPYEILCRFVQRLPRLLRRGGRLLELRSRLTATAAGGMP